MEENGGNGASTLGGVARHNNDGSVATLQEDTVDDSAPQVDVEVFLAQEIDFDVLHRHAHIQQSNETLASLLSESSLNAQGIRSEASPTTSPQPQIPHLQVVETTDPFVATGTRVPNNDTGTSPPVENNDFVAAPDDGNEDEGGLKTLDGQTLLASSRGLPGCDSREAPFSKHKREDFQRGTHDRRTSKERINRTADTANGRREFPSKYEEDYNFVDRLSDSSWTAVQDKTSPLEEFSLGTTGTAGVSRSGRSTEPLDYSEVEQVDSRLLPRKLQPRNGRDNTPGASRLDPLLSTKARLPAGSEASCESNEADWECLKLNMSDSGASTIFRSNDSYSLGLPRATTAIRNSANEEDINKKDKTDVVVGGKGKDDADPNANGPVPNDIHNVAVTDPSNDYEIIPLTNRALTGSDVSSQSSGNPSLRVVDAVFDHEPDVTGHGSGGSGFVTSCQNSGSQISMVSRFGSSGNLSTQTSSRLAPQSKDMLRLRGGRGQGRLDVVAEDREVPFDIRIDPFNGKDESPELESLGLTSASSTVGHRQDDLASGDNNEDELFVGNKQEDLKNFVRRVGKTGDLRLIVQTMEEHANSASVQEEACSVVAQLAVMCRTETMILEAGVVRAILGAMKQHESVAKVQELGCSALHSLAYANGRNVKKIAEDGGVWVILRGMKQHQSIADVQLQGCWALSNLASYDENRKLIAARGGIGVILLSMEQHRWVPAVQQWVCRVLSNLALNLEIEREIGRSGGIALVLLAMKQHQLIVGVQESACRALSKLAFDGENQEKIKEAEGIGVILCAMDQHQLAPDVQEQGCRALSQLALHGENRKEIGEAGGIGVILHAMENHPRVPDVQAQTCRALSILAENDENKKEVGDAGGIDVILRAMELHRSVAGVQNQACRALFHLGITDGSRETTREADSGGIVVFLRAIRAMPFHWRGWDASRGVAIVLGAMKQHPRVPDVQEEGCRALSELAINHVGKTAVGDAGGIGVIIRAMKEHRMVSKVQEQACQALSILAEDDDNKKKLGKADGIDAILRSMEQHQFVPGVQERACCALSELAMDDENRKKIRDAGVIGVILRAMEEHPLEDGVPTSYLMVLSKLSEDDENKMMMREDGGVAVILRTMKNCAGDWEVERLGFELVERLGQPA